MFDFRTENIIALFIFMSSILRYSVQGYLTWDEIESPQVIMLNAKDSSMVIIGCG